MSNKNKTNQLKSTTSNAKEDICISLVGPVGSGKSALIVKYLTRRFIGVYDPFYEGIWTKQETIDNYDINVQIMDTYDKDGKNLEKYLKWSDTLILVYSIIDMQSFLTIKDYLENVCEIVKRNQESNSNETSKSDKKFTKIIILGCKSDMERYRQVSKQEVENLLKKYSKSLNKINDSTNTIINDIDSSSTSVSLNLTHLETTSCEEFDLVQNLFHKIIKDTKKEKEYHMSLNQTQAQPDENVLTKFSKSKFMSVSKSRAKSPKTNANNIISSDTNLNTSNLITNSTNSSNLQTLPLQQNNQSITNSNNLNNCINTHSNESNVNNSVSSNTSFNQTSSGLYSNLLKETSSNKKNSSKFPFFFKKF